MNPFYVSNTQDNIDLLNNKDIYRKFKDVKILCLHNYGKHNDCIFNKEIDDITQVLRNYVLISAPLYKFNKYIDQCIVISGETLNKYFMGVFANQEIVLPLFFKREHSINELLKLNNGVTNMMSFLDTLSTSIYINRNQNFMNYSERMNLQNIIRNINETFYWSNLTNCRLNITQRFINRQLLYNFSTKKEVINKKEDEKVDDDNYTGINFQFKKNKYVDLALNDNYNYYSTKSSEILNILTNDKVLEICNFFISKKYFIELVNFIFALMKSKDLCHLVINNYNLMDMIINHKFTELEDKTIFQKYLIVFHHLLRYAWVAFYKDECVLKQKITKNDRFIFSSKNANILPHFPFNPIDPTTSPYLPILVNETVLNSSTNLHGINPNCNLEGNYGIVDLELFKKRMNIFISGDEDFDILKDLNYNKYKLAINGSIMTACGFKHNPLQNGTFKEFIDKYYSESDVDLLSLTNRFTFIDCLTHIIETIKTNCKVKYNQDPEVFVHTKSTVCVTFDHDYAKKYIVDDNITFEDVLNHSNVQKVKDKIYKMYVDYKFNHNSKYLNKPEWDNDKYNDIFNIVDINDMKIIVYTKDRTLSFNDGIKYKITCAYMNRPIEFYSIIGNDPFTRVSLFHLPCVRAYYDGTDFYCTPSFISSAMTFINIDYKYFAGTSHPAEIILKYNRRGLGLLLNENEKLELIKYLYTKPEWRKKFNITNSDHTNKIFGIRDVDHTLYNLPKQNKEYNFQDIIILSKQWITILLEKYPQAKQFFDTNLLEMKCVESNGCIKPMNNEVINYFMNIL